MARTSEGPLSRTEALRTVAGRLADWLDDCEPVDLYGYPPDFTSHQQQRWDEARADVSRRLRAIGVNRTAARRRAAETPIR